MGKELDALNRGLGTKIKIDITEGICSPFLVLVFVSFTLQICVVYRTLMSKTKLIVRKSSSISVQVLDVTLHMPMSR